MVKRNPHIAKLNAGYLFPEISKRMKIFSERNPDAKIISLGIGDTTEPLFPLVTTELKSYAGALSTLEGYAGYGPQQGYSVFREKIAKTLYNNLISADDIFISDGAKCDIGRLQVLFGSETRLAVQDPSYPVYIDTGVIAGQSGSYDSSTCQYHGITYMRCVPENDFFPDLANTPPTDLIYFCSPNNPTGAVATKQQLEQLVEFARQNRSIIIFDAAYSAYIRDPLLPRSIYEIEGASEVAIELGSFSKMAGFTGLRLGWSIVPSELCFEEGESVKKDWSRIVTTFFNGASNIVQMGGAAALDAEGLKEIEAMTSFYMQNAAIIKQSLEHAGYRTYGGTNTPYIWAQFPGKSSWSAFDEVLAKMHIVTTPGSGFGPSGEGFLRFSAFAHREDIEKAALRLRMQRF